MRLTQDAQTLENIKRITVFSILIFRFILCRRHSFKSHFCKVYINIANVYIKCYQIIVSFQCNAFSYAPILNQITGIWLILLFSCIIYVLRIPITVQMFFLTLSNQLLRLSFQPLPFSLIPQLQKKSVKLSKYQLLSYFT